MNNQIELKAFICKGCALECGKTTESIPVGCVNPSIFSAVFPNTEPKPNWKLIG